MECLRERMEADYEMDGTGVEISRISGPVGVHVIDGYGPNPNPKMPIFHCTRILYWRCRFQCCFSAK